MREVIDRITPLLPPGVRVELSERKHWFVLERLAPGERRQGRWIAEDSEGRPGSGHRGGFVIRSLGKTWSLWLPRRVAARVAAHEAADLVLATAFGTTDYTVKTHITERGVVVLLRLPGCQDSQPVALAPLPLALFQAG